MLRHPFIVILALADAFFVVNDCLDASTIVLNNYTRCQDDEKNPIHLNVNFTKTAHNKYAVNGEFTLDEVIDGPIEVKILINNFQFNIVDIILVI